MGKLETGDIFANKAGNSKAELFSRWFLLPKTDRWHFGILYERSDGDFTVLESVTQGLRVGKLSWYHKSDLHFYRVKCFQYLRWMAPLALLQWMGSRYDWALRTKAFYFALKTWRKEGRIRKIRIEEFPYEPNEKLVCTEAVSTAYDAVGVNIVPPDVLPAPSAFRQAEIEGRISRLDIPWLK